MSEPAKPIPNGYLHGLAGGPEDGAEDADGNQDQQSFFCPHCKVSNPPPNERCPARVP